MDLIANAIRANPELAEPSIQVIVGEVGSGKSTYSRYMSANYAALVVCNDAMGNMLRANDYKAAIKDDLPPLYHMIKGEVMRFGMEHSRIVVVDDTNLAKGTRRKITGRARELRKAKPERVPIIAIRTPPIEPETSGERRLQHDLRGYTQQEWVKIAHSHRGYATEPELDEGFDLIVYLADYI